MSLLENRHVGEIFTDELEKSLLRSACSHINNFNDPFRGNVFALLMRELIRIMMDRRAPEDHVKSTLWCGGEPWVYLDPNTKKEKLTRRSRYRYAMTGPLSDELFRKHPQLICDDEISDLLQAVDVLSKFTHISEGTHTLSPKQSEDFLLEVEGVIEDFSLKFVSLKERVRDIVGELVDEELNRHLLEVIPDELDQLSTSTRVENVSIESLEDFDFRSGSPTLSGGGVAEVELNYGGRKDGVSGSDTYPLEFIAFVDPNNLGVNIESVDVDTDSFYE